MSLQPSEISTNVRLSAMALLALASSACTATAGQVARQPCAAPSMLVCEQFGPERRCACEARTDIAVLRDALTGAAWHGGPTR